MGEHILAVLAIRLRDEREWRRVGGRRQAVSVDQVGVADDVHTIRTVRGHGPTAGKECGVTIAYRWSRRAALRGSLHDTRVELTLTLDDAEETVQCHRDAVRTLRLETHATATRAGWLLLVPWCSRHVSNSA